MRRVDREVKAMDEIIFILKKAEVLRIAMNNGKYPYILPVNFGFEMKDDQLILFIHGSNKGLKHEIIQNDCHVSFEVDCCHKLIAPSGTDACTASFAYESVIGNGRIERVKESEKEASLIKILEHYGIESKVFHPTYFTNTVVYKIIVESFTAKARKINH